MKNMIITTLTIFAFTTSPMMAGEISFDMNNAFAYSKSTQSGGSADSAGSSAASGSGGAVVVLGILAILIILIAVNSSDGHSYSPSPS